MDLLDDLDLVILKSTPYFCETIKRNQNTYKMWKSNIFFILVLMLISCNSSVDQNPANNLSKMDYMFMNGFSMELEQVYIMNGANVLPYLDSPKDSAFKSGISKINLNNFVSYDANRDTLMKIISKKEKWDISSMKTVCDTTYIEHGYGSSYFVTTVISKSTYNTVNCSNQFENRSLLINLKIGDNYSYIVNDNHLFMVQNIKDNTVYESNLYFEILTKGGIGLFNNDTNIYLDTNQIYTFSTQITAPLTGDQVKLEIANGNYTLYIYNGMTTYRIGDNLYIPRYNSYVYVGSINTNGMVINLESKYYRFKFKVI